MNIWARALAFVWVCVCVNWEEKKAYTNREVKGKWEKKELRIATIVCFLCDLEGKIGEDSENNRHIYFFSLCFTFVVVLLVLKEIWDYAKEKWESQTGKKATIRKWNECFERKLIRTPKKMLSLKWCERSSAVVSFHPTQVHPFQCHIDHHCNTENFPSQNNSNFIL